MLTPEPARSIERRTPRRVASTVQGDPAAAFDLDAVFAGLDDAERLLLAVSGGPDSMALLALASRWVRARGGPDLHIATVDHGLRADASRETAMVARAAADLGWRHETLVWEGPKPKTRLQERARHARYALLGDHARAIGAADLLTAHHADDQAETILMRLGRGSGPAGLCGMHRVMPLRAGLRLVRPLLAHRKAALVDLCRRDALPFVEDPSNGDPAFLRARLRRDAAATERLGLDAPNLLRLARRMERVEEVLETEADRVEAIMAPELGACSYRADFGLLTRSPSEILQRLLGRAVVGVGGRDALRLERLERAAAVIAAALAEHRAARLSLAGTSITLAGNGTLIVVPETPRRRGRAHVGSAAIKAELTR